MGSESSEIFAASRAKKGACGHWSLFSSAGRYLKNVLKYDTFFNEYPNSYPYEQNKLNKWFTIEVRCPWAKHEQPVEVPLYNAQNMSNAKSAIDQKVLERASNGLEYWFHGTDSKSAKDIVNKGINVKKGKRELDFSHQDGFYLNSDGMSAVKWAKSTKDASVIIHEVSAEILNGLTLLDLRGDPERWKKVIKWNRSGRNEGERLDEELNEQFEKCDYIRGPMVGDRTRYRENWEPQAIAKSDQICLKTEKIAEVIGHPRNIVGVVSWNN